MTKEIDNLKTLDDYLDSADRAKRWIREGYRCLNKADREVREYAIYGITGDTTPRHSLEDALQDVDRMYWRRAFDLTRFQQYMDAQAVDEFHNSIHSPKCPEFTIENVRATFGELFQNVDEMWRRGVVNLFARLSKNYRSNHAFKIGRRFIMRCMLEHRFMSNGMDLRYGMPRDQINDLDRVLRTLDGEDHQPRALEGAINNAMQEAPYEYEDERLFIRGFRNQNLHLYLKQQKHIDGINRIIAEHYGASIGKERAA